LRANLHLEQLARQMWRSSRSGRAEAQLAGPDFRLRDQVLDGLGVRSSSGITSPVCKSFMGLPPCCIVRR
jgi:hypothetical protein